MERFYRAARVLGINVPTGVSKPARHILAAVVTLATVILPAGPLIAAGTLTSAKLALSDPRPSQSTTHTFTGSSVDGAATVRCVKIIWSTSATGDTAPAGFSGASGSVNAASSTLINSSATGWSLAKSDGTSSTGQNNIYEYTNSTGVVPGTTTGATFVLSAISNPNTADTGYYFRLNTYSNTNCTSGTIDNATVQFINTIGSTLSLTVDASLTFTIDGVSSAQSCDGTTTTGTSTATTIPFGAVTPASNKIVCQDLSASTNATSGYSIYVRYSGAPQSGSDTIDDHTGTNALPTIFSSAGTESYGYSTDDATLGTGTADRFTNGGQKWAAASTSNAEIAYESAPVGTTHYFIGHQVGISLTTPAGVYQTNIIYTCVPVY